MKRHSLDDAVGHPSVGSTAGSGHRNWRSRWRFIALKRHLLRASLYRKQLAARFVAWSKFTEIAQNPSFDF
jgi:hypothetical protein